GVPPRSGTPSAAPARGKPGPVVGGYSQRSLSAVVWARIPRGTCSPTWSGLGFDKHLTLILLRVGHQATWGGSYSRNGQTSSSLTGRTSGLLFESVSSGGRRQRLGNRATRPPAGFRTGAGSSPACVAARSSAS